ncbi:MAG TPA: prolipoprotein diacylglyceryl transferase, partial [Pseudolabrys sp.]|nr:prolipoprotein diacylglyceryl transferase [Pseudolabrys sp.]
WGGLTMGMILSVPMIIAGLAFIAAAWQRGRRMQSQARHNNVR